MRLDPRALGLAAGLVAANVFSVCAIAVVLVPDATASVGSFLFHMDLSGMARAMTVGRFVGGLTAWTIGIGVVFGLVAALYNRWARAQ